VEGNQLNRFSVPLESNLTSVTSDQQGNILVTDAAYDWFVLLSPEGDQLSTGTIDFSFPQTAIHPQDGRLYMLSSNSLRIYDIDTAELINEIQLDEFHTYTSLAFNAEGQLYTIRDFNWDAAVVRLDPLTGQELDAFTLLNSNLNEIVARDIDIDQSGNIYILFSMNTGQVAIHKLSSQGILLQRFGLLSNDPVDWPEGTFLDPTAITVSPDGRFILVSDGYDEKSYLSAFLIEIDKNPD
jgi:6-phosphogluconolactonase (cycloisomerase 2 family)